MPRHSRPRGGVEGRGFEGEQESAMRDVLTAPRRESSAPDPQRGGRFLVVPTAVGYALVAWVSMIGLDTHWDEAVDLSIARTLRADPLPGSAHEPTQGRLPMYATALVLGSCTLP